MKSLILLVEDDPDILMLTQKTLEIADYEVLTAKNGIDAIQVLSDHPNRVPDLIISDILMPGMDGYEFFKAVSENPNWNEIPFIFLTALSTSEDVRLGKLLGVDDYITKPIRREDLYASIGGKIARNKKIKTVSNKVKELVNTLNIDVSPSITEDQKKLILLMEIQWNDYLGPDLKRHYPEEYSLNTKIEAVGTQLFQATVSIFGQEHFTQSEGILLNIDNIERSGYIFFDAYPSEKARGGEQQYMIGVVAPKINFFESLQIREVLKRISEEIKQQEDYDIEEYWNEVSQILTTPTLK